MSPNRSEQTERRLLDIISDNSRRVSEIVDNVMSMSRREPTNPQSVALDEWVRAFTNEFAAKRWRYRTTGSRSSAMTTSRSRSTRGTCARSAGISAKMRSAMPTRSGIAARSSRFAADGCRATAGRSSKSPTAGRASPSDIARSVVRALCHRSRRRHRPRSVHLARALRMQPGSARLRAAQCRRQPFPHRLRGPETLGNDFMSCTDGTGHRRRTGSL